MIEEILEWTGNSLLTATILMIVWIGAGITASILIGKNSKWAAIPAVVIFGLGSHAATSIQVQEIDSLILKDMLPIAAAIFSILTLYIFASPKVENASEVKED